MGPLGGIKRPTHVPPPSAPPQPDWEAEYVCYPNQEHLPGAMQTALHMDESAPRLQQTKKWAARGKHA